MRRGLTLIEMVFVIIIIAIISATGTISYHPGILQNDTKFTVLAIEKKRREGTGFDHRVFGGGEISDIKYRGCIVLTKEGIMNAYSEGENKYNFKSSVSGKYNGKRICFDHLGRPSEGNYTNPVSSSVDINISYSNKSFIIEILPVSGYVIIFN